MTKALYLQNYPDKLKCVKRIKGDNQGGEKHPSKISSIGRVKYMFSLFVADSGKEI
jgi:hypothetical protein